MKHHPILLTVFFLILAAALSEFNLAKAQELDPPPDGKPIRVFVDPAPGEDGQPHEETVYIDTVTQPERQSLPQFVRQSISDQVDYVEIDTLIVIYTNTAAGKLETQHVEEIKQQVRDTAEFYWRNSYLKLHLNLSFVVIDDYKDASEFEGYRPDCSWLMPYDGDNDGDYVEKDLLALGFTEDQFDSINLFWGGAGGTIPPCAGGLAFGGWQWEHLGFTQFTGNLVGIYWEVGQPFYHEFQHSIDSMYSLAGNEAYFHADYPQNTLGRFGQGWDFHATKMREWPVDDWFQLLEVWGNYRWAPDADQDGVPDFSSELYITEETLGSSPGSVDSDSDGSSDLQEAMGGMFRASNPLDADTDADGRKDGVDPEPIYPLDPGIALRSQKLNGWTANWEILMPQVTEANAPFDASLAASWDEGALYLMLQMDRPSRIVISLDPAGNGYFHGYDYELWLDPARSDPLDLVHVQDCTLEYLASHDGKCRFDDDPNYPGSPLIAAEDIEVFVRPRRGGYVVQLAIPRNEFLGLNLQENDEIGLAVQFHDVGGDWQKRAWLFELDDLIYFQLQRHNVCVSANRESIVEGLGLEKADIACVNEDEHWRIVFDASDVGIPAAADLHAFSFLDDGSILMAFDTPLTLPDAGPITPWDVVRFSPLQTGPDTVGRFELYMDGSDVGLSTESEKIEALHAGGGELFISTSGSFAVRQGGLKIRASNEDILAFSPVSLGADTSGEWRIAWQLTNTFPSLAGENVIALFNDPDLAVDEAIMVALSSAFVVEDVSGNQKDILALSNFEGPGAAIYWRGPEHGYNAAVDGLYVGNVPPYSKPSIMGRVADPEGTPLPDIDVIVYRYRAWYDYEEVALARTDGNGYYVFSDLAPDFYRVGFSDSNGAYLTEYYDDVDELSKATDIPVYSGQTAANINAAMEQGASIAGKVFSSSTGETLSDIGVVLARYEEAYDYWDSSQYTTTNNNGYYRFKGLTAGRYRVCFTDREYDYMPQCYDGAADLDSADDVLVTPGRKITGIGASLTAVVPPPNDDLDNAVEISELPSVTTQSILGATTADDDPVLPCEDMGKGYHTVWYRLQAPVSQKVSIRTQGEQLMLVAALWQGDRGHLANVACGRPDYDTWISRIDNVLLNAGETYYVEIASYDESFYGGHRISLKVLPVPEMLYVSPGGEGSVDGIEFAPGDILELDDESSWEKLFDASRLGITADLDAFTLLDDGALLMTFDQAASLPGLNGQADAWDVVKFTPDQAGSYSSGQFSWVLDGSDVGLTTSGEKIDALDEKDGRLYLSVRGRFSVTQNGQQLVAEDEDIVSFVPGILGSDTSGTWELYLDGSEAFPGLIPEDIAGLKVIDNDQLLISLTSWFRVGGASGGARDLLHLSIAQGSAVVLWHGPDHGFKRAIDGLDI